MVDFVIQREVPKLAPTFRSNHEVLEAWATHNRSLSKNTRRNRMVQLEAFIGRLPSDLSVLDLQPAHLKQYLDLYSQQCRSIARATNSSGVTVCRKNLDIEGCGVGCVGYRPRAEESMYQHVAAIHSLFSFLEYQEVIASNFVGRVRKEWMREALKGKPAKAPRFRLNTAQVRALINETMPMNRKVVYALQAKTGMRIHEVLMLTTKPGCLDLARGTITIPPKGKRRGNPVCIVDSELSALVHQYLDWRDAACKQETDAFLVSDRGLPMLPGTASKINERWFRVDGERLGIQVEGAPRGQRLHSHALRHYFSDEIERKGCPALWWHVLRGDVVKGTEGVYVDTDDPQRIREKYMAYRPIIGIEVA